MSKASVSKATGKAKVKPPKASKKDAQLLIRINADERDEFIALCEDLDTSAAREIRRFIRGFVHGHRSSDEA